MKNYHFLPVFLALLSSYIALHFYSAAWLARTFTMAPAAARATRIVFLLLAFFGPFTMFLRHRYPDPSLELLFIAGYAWMGVILLIGFTLLFSDLLGLGLKRALSAQGVYFFRIGTLAVLGALILYAFYGGLKNPALKKINLSAPGLPAAMEGLKIAQISDIHLDSSYKLEQLSSIIETVNAQNPDLVLITGDLVDPGLVVNARLIGLMHTLKPRLGVFGILGNHEYYYGYEKSLACYKELGVRLLLNESADTGGIRLTGLSDIMTEKMSETDVKNILKKHRKAGISILMSHQPLMLDLIADAGDFVGFCGHTHRGQIFPFHIFTRMVYKRFYGLYQAKKSFFYVTSGAGTWGPPMRLFAPAEIPLITLTGDKSR